MSVAADSLRFVRSENLEPAPPPSLVRGPLAWVRENFFSGPANTILTLFGLYLVYLIVPPLLNFMIFDAVWTGQGRDACREETAGRPVGACWAFIAEKINYYIYGSYPISERWRVNVFFLLLAIGVGWMLWQRAPRRDLGAVYFFGVFPLLAYGFLTGGNPFALLALFASLPIWFWVVAALAIVAALVFAMSRVGLARVARTGAYALGGIVVVLVVLFVLGWLWSLLDLEGVPTSLWGGLLVTFVVSTVGIVFSLPLGILLALGRRSKLPIVRLFAVVFIEFVRGVPLITVLFMANTMLPLFLSEGMSVDRLMRPLVGVALFAAAYMAEVVRGGLQAIPKGQYEGAMSLGLNYWKMMVFIILPQALRIVIPGIVNTFIGLFKDTTLVTIVGIFDFLRTIEASRVDPEWSAPTIGYTGYAFAAVFYFICCWGMSRYSLSVERRLAAGQRR